MTARSKGVAFELKVNTVKEATVETPRLWSLKETAEFLGVPASTMYDWISRGTAPRSYKIGKHRRFDPEHVRRWLDERASDGALQ